MSSMNKMKTALQQIRHSPLSLKIGAGLVLLVFFWYSLYGSCGAVPVKSSIAEMNKIFNGWQELRERTIPELSKDGEVSFEKLAIMQKWKTLAYQLSVPSCLDGTRSNLIDIIESDYQTFHLAKDRITTEQKIAFLSSNESLFVRYKQNVDLIEACAPLCNIDQGSPNVFDIFHK